MFLSRVDETAHFFFVTVLGCHSGAGLAGTREREKNGWARTMPFGVTFEQQKRLRSRRFHTQIMRFPTIIAAPTERCVYCQVSSIATGSGSEQKRVNRDENEVLPSLK